MLTVADNSKIFFIYKDDIVYVPEANSSQIARMSKRIADIIQFRGWNANFGLNANVPLFNNNNSNQSNCSYTYDHTITHNSIRVSINRPSDFDTESVMPDFFHAFP